MKAKIILYFLSEKIWEMPGYDIQYCYLSFWGLSLSRIQEQTYLQPIGLQA